MVVSTPFVRIIPAAAHRVNQYLNDCSLDEFNREADGNPLDGCSGMV